MELMLEVSTEQTDLEEWMTRMDDEEGEEDQDDLYHAGEEIIDRAIQACEVENVQAAFSQLISGALQRPEWTARHAGLAAIKQTIEYVDDDQTVRVLKDAIINNVNHEHARVRYTALHALGQMANDQAPDFQETHYQEILPILLAKFDDPVDRVAAMAMSAFVSFGEELDNTLMLEYAPGFMEKLVNKLVATSHRGVREESITSIAVIAGVIEKDFITYYDKMMPLLKNLVVNSTGDKEKRLRGKAFECMSLLGVAVGKERFLPDARDALRAMMTTTFESDDIQREYVSEATERIASCLGEDFKEFCAEVVAKTINELKLVDVGNVKLEEDEDDLVKVTQSDGKTVNVRSTKFEEINTSISLMTTLAREMKGAFYEFVEPCSVALTPYLTNQDNETYLSDEARTASLSAWSELITVARIGEDRLGQPQGPLRLSVRMTQLALQTITPTMDTEDDPELLGPLVSVLGECIKNVGPGAVNPVEVQALSEKIFCCMDKSIQRTCSSQQQKEKHKGRVLDEDEEGDGEEEVELRKNLLEMLGSLMEVSRETFAQAAVQGAIIQRMGVWMGQKSFKGLALYMACEVVDKLKEDCVAHWGVYMPTVIQSIGDKDPDIAVAAHYCVNVASPLPAFATLAPEAFARLSQLVSSKKPKKTDDKAKLSFDNAVAALLRLAKEHPGQSPMPAWQQVAFALNKMPLRQDEDESKKMNAMLVQMLESQNPVLLGDANANLPRILAVLAEIHHDEAICEKETEAKIKQLLKALPIDIIKQSGAGMTTKQQKKLEKIIATP